MAQRALVLVLVLAFLAPATESSYGSPAFVVRVTSSPQLLKVRDGQSGTSSRTLARAHCTPVQMQSSNEKKALRKDTLQVDTRCSRRQSMASLTLAAATCVVLKPDVAWGAVTMRSIKRAIVNIVRVRQGALLLESRLDANLLDGFQDGIKLLAMDTDLQSNVKIACEGLTELGLESRQRDAEYRADRVVQFLSQIVEYDGWDKMNRMDIREKFQAMTPEKIKFAKRGFTEVSKEIAALLALFPQDLVAECEEVPCPAPRHSHQSVRMARARMRR